MSVKPRFDNKGSEFGNVHRLLPQDCCMFDIDKMTGTAIVNLEMTRQDIGFIEYKTIFNSENKIEFKALFELKFRNSFYVQQAMKVKIGTSTFAQIEMAKKLGCRYFFVIATNGMQPFTFYEWIDDRFEKVGILQYSEYNKKQMINELWKQLGLV
jgi:hypothetical protein